MAVNPKPKVLIGISVRWLEDNFAVQQQSDMAPYHEQCGVDRRNEMDCWGCISVETGGYIHNRDTVKTEKKIGLDVSFESRLSVEYLFEEKQMIIIDLYCEEYPDYPFGQVECSIGRVIHSGGEFTKSLELNKKIEPAREDLTADVTFYVEEDTATKDNVQLKIRGFGLAKTEIFGKTDPYLSLFRRTNRGRYVQSYRTEVLRNTQNPDWKPINVSYERLCSNDIDSEICIRVYCGDGTLTETSEEVDLVCDQLVGEVRTNARELITDSMREEVKYELINLKKKKKKKSYVNSGLIYIKAQKCDSVPTFLDYMFKGLELNFIVAIDLTLSNGDSASPDSLHFMDSETNNEYSIAIQAVLEILQEYDNDELFPAFGFGARVPPEYKICHEYPLNGNFEYPYCFGAEGVIRAYQDTLKVVRLAGPTCFAPVIRYVSKVAKLSDPSQHYFILLILTDGTVDDWMETKKAVIETSYLPVSIIVVGVGGGKFSDMEILDQDFGLLSVTNEKACRDNVQFVKMRRYLRAAADGSRNIRWSKVALAKDVLAELPRQLTDYMQHRSQLTAYLDGVPSRGGSSSVFSSCLQRYHSATTPVDESPTVTSTSTNRRILSSSQRTDTIASTDEASPVTVASTSRRNLSSSQRVVSAQARSKLLKNNRQFSMDSTLASRQNYPPRKTPPFQRKYQFN